MKSYNSYLFDLDGTLLDTIDFIIASFRVALPYAENKYQQQPIEITDSVLRDSVGLPLLNSLTLFLPDLSKEQIQDVLEFYLDFQFRHWQDYITVFEGGLEILQELKLRNKSVAIVTSRRAQSSKLYCRQLGLEDYIDCYVTPELTQRHKPFPDPALKACELLGTQPADCLFVGDSPFDIRCAQGAKMDSAIVPWGATTEDVIERTGATYILRSFNDIVVKQSDKN